jgi:tRNA G10  N-methylase Trm11
LGIQIKKLLNKKGCRVIVPQTGTVLSTAQLFNSGVPFKAIGIHIVELEKARYSAMIVSAVQDIDFYTRRDRERPEADPGKGMLPVKLAQIFINFTKAEIGSKIYDPFCGAGTIVAEAMLQGFNVVATDISLRQVERTKINTDWLKNTFPNLIDPRKNVLVMAQDIEKPLREIENNSLDAVASEGWLGPATNHELSAFEIENVFVRTQQLLYALLNNINNVLKSGATVVVALPAFRVDKRIVRAPFMQEELRKFLPKGYSVENLVPEGWVNPAFRDAGQGMMLYGRPDAVILRDIVRLRKN